MITYHAFNPLTGEYIQFLELHEAVVESANNCKVMGISLDEYMIQTHNQPIVKKKNYPNGIVVMDETLESTKIRLLIEQQLNLLK